MQNQTQPSHPNSKRLSGLSDQTNQSNLNDTSDFILPSLNSFNTTPIHTQPDQKFILQDAPIQQPGPKSDISSEEEQVPIEGVVRGRAITFGRPQEPVYLNILPREPSPVQPEESIPDQIVQVNNDNIQANEVIEQVEDEEVRRNEGIASSLYLILRKLACFQYFRAMLLYLITFSGSLLLSFMRDSKATSYTGVYILAYIFLGWYLAEHIAKSLSHSILSWKKHENIFNAIDIIITILFLVFVQMRYSGIDITTKWILILYSVNTVAYFFKSSAPESYKKAQASKRVLIGIQFCLAAIKIDGNAEWNWSTTLYLVVISIFLTAFYLILMLTLFFYVIICSLLGKQMFLNIEKPVLLTGFLWSALNSALALFVLVGIFAFTIQFDYNDNRSDSTLDLCLLVMKCLTMVLIALTTSAYGRVLDYLAHFNLEKSFYEEQLQLQQAPPRSSANLSKFVREKQTTYMVRLSSTYFSPLNMSFGLKSGSRKKLYRTINRYPRKLTNSEDSINQDLKHDESGFIGNLQKEKNTNNASQNKNAIPEREFFSEADQGKSVFTMPDLKEVCLSEDFRSYEFEKVATKDRQDLCYICCNKRPDAIFPECGHGGICLDCALEVINTKGQCMQCRKEVKKVIRIEPETNLTDIVKGYETLTIVPNN